MPEPNADEDLSLDTIACRLGVFACRPSGAEPIQSGRRKIAGTNFFRIPAAHVITRHRTSSNRAPSSCASTTQRGLGKPAALAAYLERAIHEPRPAPVAPVQPFRRPSENVEMEASVNGAADIPSAPARAAAAQDLGSKSNAAWPMHRQ